ALSRRARLRRDHGSAAAARAVLVRFGIHPGGGGAPDIDRARRRPVGMARPMTPATRVPSLLALTLVVTVGRPAAAALAPAARARMVASSRVGSEVVARLE